MATEYKIKLIRESAAQSIIRDFGTFTTALLVVGAGVMMDSSAMQWLGAFFVVVWVYGKAVLLLKPWDEKTWMTPAEARKWLDDTFPETDR